MIDGEDYFDIPCVSEIQACNIKADHLDVTTKAAAPAEKECAELLLRHLGEKHERVHSSVLQELVEQHGRSWSSGKRALASLQDKGKIESAKIEGKHYYSLVGVGDLQPDTSINKSNGLAQEEVLPAVGEIETLLNQREKE